MERGQLSLLSADLRSSGAPSDEASHGSCEARWATSGSPDKSPAGAFCVGAQKLDALGDVSRSPGNITPYSPVRRSPKRRRDVFGTRLLFSSPEARSPIAGEPVILGSDRPNGGTRHDAGCPSATIPSINPSGPNDLCRGAAIVIRGYWSRRYGLSMTRGRDRTGFGRNVLCTRARRTAASRSRPACR
jgi:hypothetical protein